MNNNVDTQYIELCKYILANGDLRDDRTGTGTLSTFGHQMKFDLSKGFPLLTTKKVAFRSIVTELLWFLRGDTDISYLKKRNVKIWDGFANNLGQIGRMYGAQWRDYRYTHEIEHLKDKQPTVVKYSIDQIAILINGLINNPTSRRHIVNAWNVGELPDSTISPVENVNIGNPALPPCHMMFQCYVSNGKLSLQIYQRSTDVFLGLPFNIASYALLTHMLAQVCNLKVGNLIWTGGDNHIYLNHIEQIKTQIARYDNFGTYDLPNLKLNKEVTDIDDFTFEDIELRGYKSSGKLTGAISV